MKNPVYVGANIAVLLALLLASAITMLWLFWHFPLETAAATAAILAALSLSARLANSNDSDTDADLGRRENGFGTH
ncbi:MAG TPA: hypothetical protein VMV25_05620 [Steroidobacteraceae bacterium]|nr:hypothetical protein [Steroidobacteraceae bacterium]